MSGENGFVLLVDDDGRELADLAKQIQKQGMRSEVVFPDEINAEQLGLADLVVVDYDLKEWTKTLDHRRLSAVPRNGIALSAVLREHSISKENIPPTGFALITGKPEALGAMPAEWRPHVVSRLSNFEWFFEKQKPAQTNAAQIVSLADAIQRLPTRADTFGTLKHLLEFLGIDPEHLLWDRYRSAIERCRPPIHHLAKRSHGLVIIRWLLHRILPHTCFLLDSFALAARLRVTVSSLEEELNRRGELERALSGLLYSGPLAMFDGHRWWRDGVEQWLWDSTNGNSASGDAIQKLLAELKTTKLKFIDIRHPVVTLDRQLHREPEFASWDDVYPLHLDDWPSYAEPAYARRALVDENPEMKMYVVKDE